MPQLFATLQSPLASLPADLAYEQLSLSDDGNQIIYTFDARHDHNGIPLLLRQLDERGIDFKDLRTSESSLEDIFLGLVGGKA